MSGVPWENEEKRNHICMDHIVNGIVNEELRKLFKEEWNKLYQASFGAWDDTNISGQKLYYLEQTRSRPSKYLYQSKFRNGDTSEWDCSVLFDAILYSNSIGASLNPTIKSEVDCLREIRNKTKHNTDGKLSDSEFQTMANDVENAFKSLGISIKEITRIKVEKNLYKTFQCLPPKPTHGVVYRTQMITEICQELQKLHSDNEGQLTYFYICGNPGSGKSQLARQVCENICENVFSPTETTFVMTLDGKDLNSLRNSYENFCRRLNCDKDKLESILKLSKSAAEKIKDLRSQIETRIKNWQRWLLIVDNVENLQDISCLLPQTGDEVWKNGQIILTTQNTTNVPPDSSFTKHVSLSPGMNDQECRQLLSSLSGTDLNDHMLGEVAEQLDRQPLAIAAAGIYFKRVKKAMSEFSWPDYLEKLNGKRKNTEKELTKINTAYSLTMSTAVFLAVEKSAESNSVLKQIFQFLSLVSFEEMPLELIYAYTQQVDENADKEEIFLTTQQCSLFLPSESHGLCIRLHRVVHEVIKLFCDGRETKIESSAQCEISRNTSEVDVMAKLCRVVRALFCFKDRKDKDELIPHLKLFSTAVRNILPPNEALYLIASAFMNKNEISKIFLFFGDILNRYFCCQLSIEYQKANLQMSVEEKIPFCDEIFHTLGNSHYILCEWEKAKEFYEQALDIRRKHLGINHPDTATSLNDVGASYQKNGEWKKAKDFHEQALKIRRKQLGPNHPDTATSLHNLASLYQTTGEWEKAIELHDQALEIRRKQLGANHPATAVSLNNLGALYQDKGEWEKAKEFYEQALEICTKLFGSSHPDTTRSLTNLGTLYQQKGEWEKAIELHEQVLKICRKLFGPNHPDIATSLLNLGASYHEKGQWEKAKEFYEQALEIYTKRLGPNHPGTATSLNNLGLIYEATGVLVKAKGFLEQALQIRRKQLGPNHPDTASSLSNLGSLYEKAGEWEKALAFHEQALEIRTKELGQNHFDTASSLNNLGSLYQKIGEWDKAKGLFEQALQIRRKQLGPNHPDTASSLNNVGTLHLKKGEWEKAKEFYQQALEILRKKLGPDHPDTIAVLKHLTFIT